MKFNPNDYSTVDERLRKARKENPDMVVDTVLVSGTDIPAGEPLRWVFKCDIYKTSEDRKNNLLWSTGWASEIDGRGGMANNTSACENAETSAVGRALANAGYSGDKRASREEMDKVSRYENAARTLIKNIALAKTREDLTKLWEYASGNGLSRADGVEAAFKKRGEELNHE